MFEVELSEYPSGDSPYKELTINVSGDSAVCPTVGLDFANSFDEEELKEGGMFVHSQGIGNIAVGGCVTFTAILENSDGNIQGQSASLVIPELTVPSITEWEIEKADGATDYTMSASWINQRPDSRLYLRRANGDPGCVSPVGVAESDNATFQNFADEIFNAGEVTTNFGVSENTTIMLVIGRDDGTVDDVAYICMNFNM